MAVHSGKRSATELNIGDEMEVSGSVDHSHESSGNYSIRFKNGTSNSLKVTERSCSEKLVLSRRTFRSSSKRTIGGASVEFSSSPSKPNEINVSHGIANFPESNSRQKGKMESVSTSRQEMITSESFPLNKATDTRSFGHDNHELPNMISGSVDASRASGSSSAPVHSQKYIHQPQHKVSRSCLSFRSRASTIEDNAQTSSFKNLGCTSTSDIIPSSSSVNCNYHSADSLRARCHNGGRSSHRGLDITPYSTRSYSTSSSNLNDSGQSAAGQLLAQVNSRTVRHQPANSDRSAVSVRTRRASSRESTMRSELRDEGSHSLPDPALDPQVLISRLSFGESVDRISVQASLEESTPQRSGRDNGSSRHIYSDDRVSRNSYSHGPMHDTHGYQHSAMAEITEVLLALERIERAQQQLLSLESNFFFGSLVLHDQHRNMRMDIDNMTYEELLTLEEKMGTVSTALSEEMISKCLKKTICNHVPLEIQGCRSSDIKCSICQEEYCAGNQVGTLSCGHIYHVGCIQKWLRMKNWCPVCKVNVASSNLSDP